MTNRYDSDDACFIIDFIANPPITDANPPELFIAFYFQAATRSGIVGKSQSYR